MLGNAILTVLVTIQSVLDVRDDNLAPKGTGALFNRSILILTPARALKFTALSAERHYMWLTALSFLAHSSPEMIQTSQPATPGSESQQEGLHKNNIVEVEPFHFSHTKLASQAAAPPIVPRHHYVPPSYDGKGKDTGNRVHLPVSFRGFSGPGGSVRRGPRSISRTAMVSAGTTSDINQPKPPSSDAPGKHRTSINDVFGSLGAAPIEAFIGPIAVSGFENYPDEQDKIDMVGTHRSRSASPDSYSSSRRPASDDWYDERSTTVGEGGSIITAGEGGSITEGDDGSTTAGEEEYGIKAFRHDPFRGF